MRKNNFVGGERSFNFSSRGGGSGLSIDISQGRRPALTKLAAGQAITLKEFKMMLKNWAELVSIKKPVRISVKNFDDYLTLFSGFFPRELRQEVFFPAKEDLRHDFLEKGREASGLNF